MPNPTITSDPTGPLVGTMPASVPEPTNSPEPVDDYTSAEFRERLLAHFERARNLAIRESGQPKT